MMGVYIPGMEMPQSCHECVAGYGGCCYVAPPEADGICPDHDRPDWCSLVAVPPHGRLIDADELYEDCALDYKYEVAATTTRVNEYMQLKIDAAPTIIPAVEGET